MSDPSIHASPLGREVAYPTRRDAGLLFPIPRAVGREALGLAHVALPFVGHDRWQAWELSWLGARGKPVVATATVSVPSDSPCLIESKSLKLYLNSLNGERFASMQAVQLQIEADLSAAAGAAVVVISQDIDELLEVGDKFAALNEGRLSEPVPTKGLSVDQIGLMLGGAHGMHKAEVHHAEA